jgi:ABC-type cobalamin transport system ATPase subunit
LITQKTRMALAAVGAMLVTLLLTGISYFLSLDNSKDSLGMPPISEASFLNQVLVALCWVGLAVLISFSIVAIGVLISRIRKTRTP